MTATVNDSDQQAFEASDFSAFLSRYEGFGSFFSADVEVLIRQPDGVYQPPTQPAFASLEKALEATGGDRYAGIGSSAHQPEDNPNTPTTTPDATATGHQSNTVRKAFDHLPTPPPFGRAFRDAFFGIRDDFTFINHGAFGGALTLGVHLKHQYETLMESQLLTFMDRSVLPWVAHATREVAKTVLRCKPTELVLVPNATYGLNAAINGLITFGDVVVFFDTEYLAVFKMLQERCETLLAAARAAGGGGNLLPAALKELPLDGLLVDNAIMGSNEALAAHIVKFMPRDATVIVMDLITSTGSLHLPVFTHIIPALKKHLPNLRHIIVDGAHGPLQCDVDFSSFAPEQLPSVYVGNLHKWFSAPKSAGVLWVREDVQDSIRPIIVSHGAKNGFLSDFIWDGTRDHGSILALPTIIDFWYHYIGVDRVRQYCHSLKEEAIAMLMAAWGCEVGNVPRGAPFMSLVLLPPFFQQHSKFLTAKYLQDALHHKHSIEVPVKVIRGRLYLRVSFFVNNEMSDYQKLRDAVLAIQDQIKEGLMSARRTRLQRSGESCDNPNTHAKVGEKRSRSPPPASAEAESEDAKQLSAQELSRRAQQQHHDKSQIVRLSPTIQPDSHHAPPLLANTSARDSPNPGASVPFYPHSATNGLAPYSPLVLDVPLSYGSEMITVDTTQWRKPRSTSSVGDAAVTNKNGSGDDIARSTSLPHSPTGATDAAGNGNGAASPHDFTTSHGQGAAITKNDGITVVAVAKNSAVDPNCNGCGLGALGTAPKKTRKF